MDIDIVICYIRTYLKHRFPVVEARSHPFGRIDELVRVDVVQLSTFASDTTPKHESSSLVTLLPEMYFKFLCPLPHPRDIVALIIRLYKKKKIQLHV